MRTQKLTFFTLTYFTESQVKVLSLGIMVVGCRIGIAASLIFCLTIYVVEDI